MKPVFGLTPDDAGRGIEDIIGNLLVGVSGQAMKKGGAGPGKFHDFWSDAVGGELLHARFFFIFHAHADPDIGIDGIRALGRFFGIGLKGPALGKPGLFRHGARGGIRRIILGPAEDNLHAEYPCGEHPGVCHVAVGVAEEDHFPALEGIQGRGSRPRPGFRQSKAIGVDLAGMIKVTQGIDHGNGSLPGKSIQQVVLVTADDDPMKVTGKDFGGIGGRFTATELCPRSVDNDRVSAQLGDPDLKADPGARAALIKDHGPGLPIQCPGRSMATTIFFKIMGQAEPFREFFGLEIGFQNKVSHEMEWLVG